MVIFGLIMILLFFIMIAGVVEEYTEGETDLPIWAEIFYIIIRAGTCIIIALIIMKLIL